jgi:hypothetical protein
MPHLPKKTLPAATRPEPENFSCAWQPPTEEQIRRRAYELYLERERECGGALDDWLEAEAQLLLQPTVTKGRRGDDNRD